MTSIIFRGLENNTFSIFSFIKSRAKRIVPALTVIILTLLVIGYICLEPVTYKFIGKHSVSSLLFISNYIYSLESGYFDLEASDKFLLHTWSLSIEWQFYIIYPLVLFILSKVISIRALKVFVIIIAIISLLISSVYTTINPSASYFMLYTRAWEMALGGIAFLYPLKLNINKRVMELFGISIIVTSVLVIDKSTAWPGYIALLPVLGTYLCIVTQNSPSLLSNLFLQKIGLWSYSIYLVHWPVLVFFHKLQVELTIPLYLVITIILSIIIYTYIEKRRNHSYGFICIYIFAVIFSYSVYLDGYQNRINGGYIDNFHKKYYGGEGIKNDASIVRFNENEDVEFILIGDSLARQYANYYNENKIGFIGIFKDGCFSSEDKYLVYYNENKESCISRYRNLIESIKNNGKANIIIAQRWDESIQLKNIKTDTIDDNKATINSIAEYINSVSRKTNASQKIFILSLAQGTKKSVFECVQNNKLAFYEYFAHKNCYTREERNELIINSKLKEIARGIPNVNYININDFICNEKSCTVTDAESNPIYSDNYHFSIYGARKVGSDIYEYIYGNKIQN